jgi:hypothetical protein
VIPDDESKFAVAFVLPKPTRVVDAVLAASWYVLVGPPYAVMVPVFPLVVPSVKLLRMLVAEPVTKFEFVIVL